MKNNAFINKAKETEFKNVLNSFSLVKVYSMKMRKKTNIKFV